jgi:hypothetical protein
VSWDGFGGKFAIRTTYDHPKDQNLALFFFGADPGTLAVPAAAQRGLSRAAMRPRTHQTRFSLYRFNSGLETISVRVDHAKPSGIHSVGVKRASYINPKARKGVRPQYPAAHAPQMSRNESETARGVFLHAILRVGLSIESGSLSSPRNPILGRRYFRAGRSPKRYITQSGAACRGNVTLDSTPTFTQTKTMISPLPSPPTPWPRHDRP